MEGSRDGAMADGASRGPQSRCRPFPKLTTGELRCDADVGALRAPVRVVVVSLFEPVNITPKHENDVAACRWRKSSG